MTADSERSGSSRLRLHEVIVESTAIWISLARLRRRLLRVVERHLKRVGLPPLLWHDALLLLTSQPSGESSAPQLEQQLSLPQYKVSRLIHGLVEGGLVTRRHLPVSGRTMLVRLTARGRELQQRMAEVYASAINQEFSGQFTEEEADALVALLDRFCDAKSAPARAEKVKTPRSSTNAQTFVAAELAE